jgi:hypothetical protein
MKLIQRVSSAFVFLIVALMAANVVAQNSAKATATEFYQTYLELNVRGLPDATTHVRLVSFLDPSLTGLIEKARSRQTEFIKQHPDEKPPWIEGDLFSSLFEGAQSFVVGATRVKGARTEVDVRLSHKEGSSLVSWTDTLVLTKTKSGWRISNIVFKGKWQFSNGTSLRHVLMAP